MTNKRFYRFILWHPNTLTIARIIAVPILIVFMMFFKSVLMMRLSALVFILASITDYLDGYFARRYGLESNFGRLIDPLADKLLVVLAFIMLSSIGWVAGWIVCIIVGRELLITGFRAVIAKENSQVVAASWLGKYKTIFQIIALFALILHYPVFGINVEAIGNFFLWPAVILTIWSAVDYFIRFGRVFFSVDNNAQKG